MSCSSPNMKPTADDKSITGSRSCGSETSNTSFMNFGTWIAAKALIDSTNRFDCRFSLLIGKNPKHLLNQFF